MSVVVILLFAMNGLAVLTLPLPAGGTTQIKLVPLLAKYEPLGPRVSGHKIVLPSLVMPLMVILPSSSIKTLEFFKKLSNNYLELLDDKDDFNVIINIGKPKH